MLVDTVLYSTRISGCRKSWSLPADDENGVEISREEGTGDGRLAVMTLVLW
jgi:hypothetical protein